MSHAWKIAFVLVINAMVASPVRSSVTRPTTAPSPAKLLYPIQVGDKYGYIDYSGKIAIPPRFNAATSFGEDGLAIVYHGRVDPADPADPLHLGRPMAINQEGDVVLEDAVIALGRGRLGVRRRDGDVRIVGLWEPFKTTVRFTGIGGSFKEGLLPVLIDGRWGFMNERGELAIAPICDSTGGFQEGLAASRSGEAWGFLSHAGEWVIKPQFASVDNFHEGVAWGLVGDLYYYVDRRGERFIRTGYEQVQSFAEGLAVVREVGAKLSGYIDKSGRYSIPPKSRLASSFREGLAYAVSAEGVAGYIDHSGQFVIRLPSECYGITGFQNGRAPVQLEHSHGYINVSGAWIWSIEDR